MKERQGGERLLREVTDEGRRVDPCALEEAGIRLGGPLELLVMLPCKHGEQVRR